MDDSPVEAIHQKSLLELLDLSNDPDAEAIIRNGFRCAKIHLNLVCDEHLRQLCRDANLEDTGDRERNIEALRRYANDDMETHIIVSYTADECDQMETGYGAGVLNDFTPINRPRIKVPVGDSHGVESAPRHALPDSPESLYQSPLIDWLAPGISAAEIRRECASRMPPIHIATRLLAAEVKSKYGAMLTRLDKEKSDSLPEHGSKHSPPDKEVPETREYHRTSAAKDFSKKNQLPSPPSSERQFGRPQPSKDLSQPQSESELTGVTGDCDKEDKEIFVVEEPIAKLRYRREKSNRGGGKTGTRSDN
jgi:hypothetical protein